MMAPGRDRPRARAERGAHAPAAPSLPQGVLLHARYELPADLRATTAREVGVDPLAEAGEAQVVEPCDLRLGEAVLAHVDQRRTPPESKRLTQRLGRLPGLSPGQLLHASQAAILETVGIDRPPRHTQGVAASL